MMQTLSMQLQLSKTNNNKIKHATFLYYLKQGVVTLIEPVEPFATGIKMKSSDQETI